MLGIVPLQARVWISEFVASNQGGFVDQAGDAEDWLELYNESETELSLAGWSLTDDPADLRKWIIPSVSVPAKRYLVIFASGKNLRDPEEELHASFSLNKSGEYLGLVRPDGVTVEHEYAPQFPGQFEDISFGLRQTGETTTVVVPEGAPGEAGVPASAADFAAEFAGWNTNLGGPFTGSTWRGVASGVGLDRDGVYGAWLGAGGDFESELYDRNGSVFLRLFFAIPDPAEVTGAKLRMRWDDGFIAYVNGTRVAANRDPGAPGWNSLATSDRGSGENDDWMSFPIDLAVVTLQAGENLLAIHGLNHRVDSPNLLVLPVLEVTTGGVGAGGPVYHVQPTPGRPNGAGATVLAPLLDEVTSSPTPPTGLPSSPPIVITARVQATVNPIRQVRLYHRKMFLEETVVRMKDDGNAPDAVAGDGTYTAEISTDELARGHMVRWRVEAEDSNGEIARDPAYDAPTDSDQYYGTVADDVALGSSRLPFLHTFVPNEAAVDTRGGGRVSIYYLGRFYDNVRMDLHGQSTSGSNFPKKSYDVDFNRGNRFLWKEGEQEVKDINLLTNYADKSKVRNTLTYEFLKRCGTDYHYAFPVRVQRNGTFYSIHDLVEDGDDRFLERLGLDGNGALYKMYDRLANASSANKKTRTHEGTGDLAALISAMNPGQSVDVRRGNGYDMLNIPATINYLASLTVAGITDAGHKNYYMYRDTEGTQEWWPMPWDVDLALGRRWTGSEHYFHDTLHWDFWNYSSINPLWDLMHNTPEFREMYLRRVQSLREEVLLPPGTRPERDWFTMRVRELEELLDPPGVRSDADLDFVKWGSWGNNFQMRDAAERILTEWLPNRRDWMFSSDRGQGGVPVPEPQLQVPDITIERADYNPSSGNQDEEYFLLRNRESTSVDLSGWSISSAVQYVLPAGTVIPADSGVSGLSRYVGLLHVARRPEAFRNRARLPTGGQSRFVVGGYEGQLSARGETIELRTAVGDLVASKTYLGNPSLAQQYLRIAEINYHPESPTPAEEASLPGVSAEDFEWIEFLNVGSVDLELAGVKFTDGIDYTFGEVTLGSGQRLILAKHPAAFALRHPGVTAAVAGPYSGLLNNDGEHVRLVDPSGENVLSFDYNDRWYPPTDGGGRSLVLRDEGTSWNLFDEPESWGMSEVLQGSAGVASSGYLVHFNGWQAAHFSAAEREDPLVGTALANPDGDPYPNWQEYAFGLLPRVPDAALFRGEVISVDDQEYLGATVRRRSHALDLEWDLQVSSDAENWVTELHDRIALTPHADGSETWSVRESAAVGDFATRLARLRVQFGP